MDNNRYPRQCYIMLKHLDDIGRKTWVSNIRNVLYSFGFGYVWLSQDNGDTDSFLNIFKHRVCDCYLQKWHEVLKRY